MHATSCLIESVLYHTDIVTQGYVFEDAAAFAEVVLALPPTFSADGNQWLMITFNN
jgi:hypothetical protein